MTSTVGNTDLSPGEVALEATRESALLSAHEKRIAGLAKAREAKAAKAALREAGALDDDTRDAFWREIFLTLARNREARGQKDWVACIAVTDEVIDALEEAGKI
jgi:hypothetical protein